MSLEFLLAWVLGALFLTLGSALANDDASPSSAEQMLTRYCIDRSDVDLLVNFLEKVPEANGINPFSDPIFIRTAPGNCVEAARYYARVGEFLGLQLIVGSNESTVSQVVEFLGYRGMTANDLEVQPPHKLMPKTEAEHQALVEDAEFPSGFAVPLEDFQDDNVIAVRFFAPKVADYNKDLPLPGWRKLVRLRALKGSSAAAKDVKAAWILFNAIRAPQGKDWGLHRIYASKNNQSEFVNAQAIQILLELTAEGAAKADRPSLYFLSYFGKYNRDISGTIPYGLSLFLDAKFDVSDAYLHAQEGTYYVPSACSQCHGVAFRGPKLPCDVEETLTGVVADRLSLNYLDTDQWYHARASVDFKALDDYRIPVLIDADSTGDQAAYKELFDRFRKLNQEIAEQNGRALEPTSLQVRSVGTWLRNHRDTEDHVDRWSRALPPLAAGDLVWDRNNPNDLDLLQDLERFCARCHMAMFFGIYDKETVNSKAGWAIRRLNSSPAPGQLYYRMPQGRMLLSEQKKRLVGYLQNLSGEKAAILPKEEAQCR